MTHRSLSEKAECLQDEHLVDTEPGDRTLAHMPKSKRRRRSGDPKVAIGYLRVSTDEQHLGPEAQRAELHRWAEREGVTLAGVYEDIGISGAMALEKRPGLLAAIGALEQHGAGLLVAAKRDRFARDIFVMAMLEKLAEHSGARAIAVDDDAKAEANDPSAFLMRSMKDAFAQYERLVISARTRAALGVKKSRGERTGGVPMGQRVDGDGKRLAPDEVEGAAVARIVELRGQGLSIRAIAAALDVEGVQARGERWHKTTVDRVLRRIQAT